MKKKLTTLAIIIAVNSIAQSVNIFDEIAAEGETQVGNTENLYMTITKYIMYFALAAMGGLAIFGGERGIKTLKSWVGLFLVGCVLLYVAGSLIY